MSKSRTIGDSSRPCHYLMIRWRQRIDAQPCRRAISIAVSVGLACFWTSACPREELSVVSCDSVLCSAGAVPGPSVVLPLFQLVISWDIGLSSDPPGWFRESH